MILFYEKQYLKESFFSLEEKRHVSHHSSPSLSMPTSFQAIAPVCHTPKSFSTWIRSNIYEKQLEISEFQMCGTKKWLDFSSWVLGFSWSRVKMPLGEKRGDYHVLRGEVSPCTNFGQIKQGSLQFGQYMMTWQPYPVSPVCLASPWGLGTGAPYSKEFTMTWFSPPFSIFCSLLPLKRHELTMSYRQGLWQAAVVFVWPARSEEGAQWTKCTPCQPVDQHPVNARPTWSPPVVPPLQRQGWDPQGKLAS